MSKPEHELYNVVLETKYFRQWTAGELAQLSEERLDEITQQYENAATTLLKISVAATLEGKRRFGAG